MEKAPPTSQPLPAGEPGPAPAGEPGSGAAGEPRPAARSRRDRRVRDLVISLAVLLVPVLLLVGGYQIVSGRNQPVAVDPAPAVAEAEAAGMAVATPTGLGDGWVPVSAVFQHAEDGFTLRIGYLTPDGPSVQAVQSTVPADRLLPAELPENAQLAGAVDVDGEPWQLYANQDGDRVLVRLAPDLTSLVVGATGEDQLRELAASLG